MGTVRIVDRLDERMSEVVQFGHCVVPFCDPFRDGRAVCAAKPSTRL